jgi:SAM-dependent MidA family methyltransferase
MSPTPLQQLIIERIQRDGPITFADYMRMALYEPGYGYYVTGPAKMGWEGDYYTSPDVSTFFAHCMGRQLHQMWELLDHPTPFVVLEQGAGRGNLGSGIQKWATQTFPAFHAVLDYRSEDINTGQDALSGKEDHPAVILSNELVDAFPVHIVEVRDKRLYEVYVGVQEDGRFYQLLDEASSPDVACYLDSYKIPWSTFADGWRAEINLDAGRWMTHTAQRLTRSSQGSFILTIDYGDRAQELYTSDEQEGTLVCYYQHQLTNRPLVRPGEQDITAHVNFSALIREGRRHGLHLYSFMTQRKWLTDMGIYEELESVRARDFAVMDNARASDQGQIALLKWNNVRQGVTALTNPDGMGKFKVLILKGKDNSDDRASS